MAKNVIPTEPTQQYIKLSSNYPSLSPSFSLCNPLNQSSRSSMSYNNEKSSNQQISHFPEERVFLVTEKQLVIKNIADLST